jgi:cytochrome c-type biogenesis protein CcmH/NrfF
MLKQVSFPFTEMAQGVMENGLGYIAEKSSKSYTWLLWLFLPLLLIVVGIIYFTRQDKKKEEAKKLGEEKQRLLEEEKAKQNLLNV